MKASVRMRASGSSRSPSPRSTPGARKRNAGLTVCLRARRRSDSRRSKMALKPWYKVATPREDLREERPLDASEFAVHLDQVRDGTAPKVYRVPSEFFERTFLTKSLGSLASEVVRRLSGVQVETSAV